MPKVTMPQLGESVSEGTIGKWLKQVGDHVDKYEPIVEVITDKVNAEVPSPFAGTLTAILVPEGETVPNNAEIAEIDGTAEAPAVKAEAQVEAPPSRSTPAAATPAPAVYSEPKSGPGFGPAGSDERPMADYEGRVTPAVRRLAREHEIDLSLVTGTGHDSRVTREDLLAYIERLRTAALAPAAPAPAATTGASTAAPAAKPALAPSPVSVPPALAGEDELVATTPMRKAIAAQMFRSKSTAPHAYTTVEVDLSGLVALRDSIKADYQAREGIGLSFVPFVTKAVVEALRKSPDLNAHWTNEGLLRRRHINIGIAVAVEGGLVVPVIHDADALSINGLNRAIVDLATKARNSKLKYEDITGGTFTVNNTGWFGSVSSQPIINVPEVAILSMEAIVKRPVVLETPNGDVIAIRPMMNICTSFDHRATDGAQIGRFVQDVRKWLESVDSDTSIW
ncbi:MAG: dihydrolipoamide acetyltransferase family protein [Candidatus Limnocylindrales bacterium]